MKLRTRRPVSSSVKIQVRYGSVPFLNARPLCQDIPGVLLDYPPALLKALQSGEIDVALLSSVELLRNPGFDYIRGLGIVSDGPVESVRLYYRKPVLQIRTVGWDPHSLTANALGRILLHRRYKIDPKDASRTKADAALVIGDAAFRFATGPYLDLGAEWKEWTGLPFVYALWIHRRDLPDPDSVRRSLVSAFEAGSRHLEDLASREAARLGLDKTFVLRYLKDTIRYQVGKREEQGLDRFRKELESL